MPRPVARLSTDDIASDAAARLAQELQDAKTLTLGGESLDLTDKARTALSKLFELLASGQRVEVVPVAEMLTTQQAANLLDVSRPTLVKLLESGLIPYEQPYVHRRISRAAIDEFIASGSERRLTGLEALANTLDPEVPDDYVATRPRRSAATSTSQSAPPAPLASPGPTPAAPPA
jgi:excisionase family DNA binding protein